MSLSGCRARLPGHPVVPTRPVLGRLLIIEELRPVAVQVFVVWGAVALIWCLSHGKRTGTCAGTSRWA